MDDQKLRTRFFHEAQRLLEIEQGKPSLTNMQALFLLYLYTACAAMGKAMQGEETKDEEPVGYLPRLLMLPTASIAPSKNA